MQIDRTKWELTDGPDRGEYVVTVDGLDAGQIFEDEDDIAAGLVNAEWPFPVGMFDSVEDAFAAIQRAWAEYWAYCNSCGEATTEEDRRVLPVNVDDIGAYCRSCRGDDVDETWGEPAGAFGYWPGEDARPSAADRPDGIGRDEAAQILAEEAARRATHDTRDCGCAYDPAQGGRQVLVCRPHADEHREEALA